MSRPRSSKSTATSRRQTSNQLRIIGGQWRGRKLSFPDIEGLRPTGDRVRETLFNWLNFELPGARCLDLFAGSGALGLEALSRGAAHSTLVERDPGAARSLRQHCQALEADAELVEADALQWLTGGTDRPYQILFLDPPFHRDLLDRACRHLEQHHWLAEDALIYIETAVGTAPAIPANWQLRKEKLAGQVAYRLYARHG